MTPCHRAFWIFISFIALTFATPNAAADEPAPQTKADITARSFAGVDFTQTRIDHNETNYDTDARALAARFGSSNATNLPLNPRLAEMVRLWVAINTRCVYCMILHAREARELGIATAKIDALPAWRETRLFSDAERAALTYAEALSTLNDKAIQSAHEQVRAYFNSKEIETLMMVIVNMDAYARIFLAQGRQPALK